ncbi:hypothetical protein Godav_017597, partial [Gossypium davidsonii]|nr:hypothetical protein [Gossypium davidsonii]
PNQIDGGRFSKSEDTGWGGGKGRRGRGATGILPGGASEEEDPMEVPLTYSFFWVQVHDLLPEMMSKVVAKQFGDFIGSFIEYYMKQIGKG